SRPPRTRPRQSRPCLAECQRAPASGRVLVPNLRFWWPMRGGPQGPVPVNARSSRRPSMRSATGKRVSGRWRPVGGTAEAAGPNERKELGPDFSEPVVELVMTHRDVEAVLVALQEGVALEAECSVTARRLFM